MKKKIKKFLFSRKGGYAIIAIIMIPIILAIVSTLVCNQRNNTVYRTEIKNSITSYFEYANKYNANIVSRLDDTGVRKDYCNYNSSQQAKIISEFDAYFKQIDGYNGLWTYETITFKEEDGNYTIQFKCYCYIPKIKSLKVVNYWGRLNDDTSSPNLTTDYGWYYEHQNTLRELFSHGVDESGAIDETANLATPYVIDSKYWQKIVVEVNSSCV